MKNLKYSIEIKAPKKKVWQMMLDLHTYKQWVDVSWPGSYYEGEWKKGAKIKFRGGENQGGTVAKIVDLDEYKSVLAEHIAVLIADGSEDRSSELAMGWIGTTERYTFSEKNNITELVVEIKTTPEWEQMFNDGWPGALQSLKAICEK